MKKIKKKIQEIAINFYMHVHNFFIYKSMCINVETEIIKEGVSLRPAVYLFHSILMYFMLVLVLVIWVDALKKHYCTDS